MRTAAFLAALLAASTITGDALAQRRPAAARPAATATPAADPAPTTPPAPPAPPPPTLLVAATVDGATVALDGADVGTTPLAPFEVTAGSHTVTVRRDGYEATSRQVSITETGSFRVDLDLAPNAETAERLRRQRSAPDEVFEEPVESATDDPWYTRWYVWAGAGAVVATAVIVGVVVATTSGEAAPPNGAIPIPPIR